MSCPSPLAPDDGERPQARHYLHRFTPAACYFSTRYYEGAAGELQILSSKMRLFIVLRAPLHQMMKAAAMQRHQMLRPALQNRLADRRRDVRAVP
ncbi:protein of unknown function [Methylocella tundrae]|uniref:Uncharacterized protein n=1 Tax=Methylocella tundrae TaxID=227605 RepID=A0A4U8Z5H0_METTU|nr:protein of unknown function [Methylocella tundrae]